MAAAVIQLLYDTLTCLQQVVVVAGCGLDRRSASQLTSLAGTRRQM